MKHTVVAWMEDRPGVLTRVTSLFRRRGFNIESLAVGHSETDGISRMTFVVSGDEREAGQRTLLNYGHTLGHAIESVSGYAAYLHGEAVAIGMRAAGIISVEMGLLSPADFDRQQRLIQACGLPASAPGLDIDAVLSAASGDKKVRGGAIRWVLLDRIGHALVRDDVPLDLVRKAAALVLPPA